MNLQQNLQERPEEGNTPNSTNRPTLAALYAATVSEYFCSETAAAQLQEGAYRMGEILQELGRLAAGTIPALMHVTAHYAATARDADKAATLATLTAPNGAAAALALIASEADRLSIWGDIFETLADG